MFRKLFLVLGIIFSVVAVSAIEPTDSTSTRHIADGISAKSDIKIKIPENVYSRLKPVEPQENEPQTEAENNNVTPAPQTHGRMAGYRVQAFSGNNASAKSEGQQRERQIRAKYPNQSTYLTYGAPYWRLRVGDFRSRDEAEAFASELKKKFPSFKREITVVHDRVTISQ